MSRRQFLLFWSSRNIFESFNLFLAPCLSQNLQNFNKHVSHWGKLGGSKEREIILYKVKWWGRIFVNNLSLCDSKVNKRLDRAKILKDAIEK